MKNVLGDDAINFPGLIFTGAGIVNYFQFIATWFPHASPDPDRVLNCLIVA